MVSPPWHQHPTQNELSEPYWGPKWHPGQALRRKTLKEPLPVSDEWDQGCLWHRPCFAPALGSSPGDPHPWQMVGMGQRDGVRGNGGQEQGLALDLTSPLARILLREALVLGWGQDGGSVGSGEEMLSTRGGTPVPVPSCTPALYTSLFISVQNHVSIYTKSTPPFTPPSPLMSVP